MMTYFAFLGPRLLAQGTLPDVVRAVAHAGLRDLQAPPPLLVFDAESQLIELDLRGSPDEAASRVGVPGHDPVVRQETPPAPPRPRGRPPLGVVAREVTLLPRHWEWLALHPGGASVALRRLIDDARRAERDGPQAATLAARQLARAAQERCYRFVRAIAGNLPGYEEGLRALFGGQAQGFEAAIKGWPEDLRSHAWHLAEGAFPQSVGAEENFSA
ncbi:DUF2239 family protein [Hylemonella gracilis]|uniref:DUF2239 family protein n=1 Tax=Hylemonella gracilis TaxID=80880 RepID=A0A4P6UIR4_9BURK|nr:DUF2239 family protein [Hylemonella gracilis]QBK03945.1 DUF2239 family protein [Hylemonella gracilis]